MGAKVLPAWVPYRPGNGTEGEMFHEAWCSKCARDVAVIRREDYARGCPILSSALALHLDDPNYPKEWIRQANDDEWPGSARCTAFVPLADLDRRLKEAGEKAAETRRRHAREAFAGDLFTEPAP